MVEVVALDITSDVTSGGSLMMIVNCVHCRLELILSDFDFFCRILNSFECCVTKTKIKLIFSYV